MLLCTMVLIMTISLNDCQNNDTQHNKNQRNRHVCENQHYGSIMDLILTFSITINYHHAECRYA
jgi:hypothetical protein